MINKNTLAKLVKQLVENRICCGIGGSYLLKLYHLYDNPDDVDFWVRQEDMEKLRGLFSDYKEINENLQLPDEYHFKMVYDDIIADFISCFVIKPNQNRFEFHLMPASIEMKYDGENCVPCTQLEDWYIAYSFLGKKEKAAKIGEFLSLGGRKNASSGMKIQKSLEFEKNTLSLRIQKELDDFAVSLMQFHISDYC